MAESNSNANDTSVDFDPYAMPAAAIQDPPQSLWTALRKIGPGIILAGTIVGSGELILTTSLGAEFGYIFLWLILFSCVIKVFVQIELGRYAISSGKPTLGAINELPGPRLGAHLLVWWWLFMMIGTIFQLGAMTGGVGQSLNLAFPGVAKSFQHMTQSSLPSVAETVNTNPEFIWAVFTCVVAIALLWSGSYRRVELLTTVLVVGVTVITVTAMIALQGTEYPIRWEAVKQGLMLGVPAAGVAKAFSVFGITGVGASELFYYPYWCLEKGYARYAGKRDDSPDWERRARGWIRVLYLDAWTSMVVFTVSTVAFYFMGAAVLHAKGLNPKGPAMIKALSQMYVGPFGEWTQLLFLVGAGAVLFKTLYASSAGNGRMLADFLSLGKFVRIQSHEQRASWSRALCLFYPVVALALFLLAKEPKWMVVVGGCAQAATLPMISAAAVFFRYRRTDQRIAPSIAWDLCLWIAFVSITVVAVYALWSQLTTYFSSPG